MKRKNSKPQKGLNRWLEGRRRLLRGLMSANATTFEVRVLVYRGDTRFKVYNYYGKAELSRDSVVKTYHIDANKSEQASEKAKKYGKLLSCRKVNVSKIVGDIEKMSLEPVSSIYGEGIPYSNAVAMDEMIWKKRNNRRAEIHRDKKE